MQGDFLNKKEIKRILEQVEKQWGFTEEMNYVFFKNNKQRVSIVNKELAQLDLSKLRLNSLGMYFCEVMSSGEIRLSIEGSQLVGPFATKNVVPVSQEQAKQWLYGQDLELPASVHGFVILQFGNYFIGCGRYKDGLISNHVSKNRRIGTLN